MGGLQIRALGQLQLELAGNFITDQLPVKGRALLVYLAVTERAQPREALAGLLWSEMPDDVARTNLRVMLSKLRKAVGDHLQISRERVGLTDGVWVDVREVVGRQERGERREGSGGRERWRTAVALYVDDFLANFYVPDAPLFDEWMLVERERLRQIVLTLLHKLVQQSLEQPALTEEGIAYARRILALDEWREEAHRQLMLLLARDGQRGAALAQFERCRQVLVEALGVEPATETVALYEQIKADTLPKPDLMTALPMQPRRVAHHLPLAASPFVGRTAELIQLDRLLGEAECRLLTLIGPGGMGKTRLAVQAAQMQLGSGRFADGLFFVPLTAVTNPDHLIAAIAQAVNFSFSGREPAEIQLLNYLREKRLLLVLDNFEQLLEAAGLLAEIVAAASQVKLLVTSRAQLNLYQEWRYDVHSLAIPTGAEPNWQEASSVQLFAQRARRSRVDFDLVAEKTAVLQICQLVAGMPLGLELAAAWVRALPCAEIAQEIARNLDFLATAVQDIPDRHRSLRATFNYSWELLAEKEQLVLQQLTVFQSGFTRAAAETVAGASLRSLSLLLDKSFVQRIGNGRYQIHEILQQFAAEKMGEAERTAVAQAHASYFAQQIHIDLEHTFNQSQLATIQEDIDNYRAAWHWLVTQKDSALLQLMLEGFYRFYMTQGWHQEGFNQMARAAQQWQGQPEAEALLGRLLARQGQCGQLTISDLAGPTHCLRQALDIARRLDDAAEIALALNGLGFMELMQSHYSQAAAYLRESISLCRARGFQHLLGNALNIMASVLGRQGAFAEAKAICQEGLQVRRFIADESGTASSLTNLGSIQCSLAEYESGQVVFAEALQLCRQLGHKVGIANALTGLFQTAFYTQQREMAAHYGRESLDFYHDAGDRWGMAIALHNLGYLAADGQEHEAARNYFMEAIALYRQIGVKSSLANTLKSLAVTCLALGEEETAVAHFHEALQLASDSQILYVMAEILLEIAVMWQRGGRTPWAAGLLTVVKNAAETRERFRLQAEEVLNSLATEELEKVDWRERPLAEVAAIVLHALDNSIQKVDYAL